MNELIDDQIFLSPSFFANPYPFYNMLRNYEPVYWSNVKECWLITRYDDVFQGLRDLRLTVKRDKRNIISLPIDQQVELQFLRQFFSNWLLYLDPPEHTRIRKAISKAFTKQAIEYRQQSIVTIASKLLSSLQNRSTVDLLGDYATPLSVMVVADILGVKEQDYARVKAWSDQIVDYVVGRSKGYSGGLVAQQAATELLDFLEQIFVDPPELPDYSLLFQLISAQKQHILSKEEVLAIYANVLIDGHEPIANGLANGLLALLQYPDQLLLLQQEPNHIPGAVEEILRYNSPFQFSGRVASTEIKLHNTTISAGDRVLLMLGSANRDPSQFPDPDSFDIRRSSNRHLAFALGTHYCLGRVLAQCALAIGLQTLVNDLVHMRLGDELLSWHHALAIRSLHALPVVLYNNSKSITS